MSLSFPVEKTTIEKECEFVARSLTTTTKTTIKISEWQHFKKTAACYSAIPSHAKKKSKNKMWHSTWRSKSLSELTPYKT